MTAMQHDTTNPTCARCGDDLRRCVHVPSTPAQDQDFDAPARCWTCGAEHVVTVYLSVRFDVRPAPDPLRRVTT